MPDRSPEERERARLEREARRAKKEGRTPPPVPPDRPNVPNPAPEGGIRDVRAVEPELPPAPSTPPPPATGRDWRREAGDPDPDPPLVRRVEGNGPREELHGHDEPLPEPPAPQPPGRRIPPPPALGDERAIGTRRVAAGRRPHLPRRRTPRPAGAGGGVRGNAWTGRVALAVALTALVFVLWFAASLFQPFSGEGGGAVTVTIPEGSSVADVAELLERESVIGSAWFFKLRAKLEGRDQLRSGEVELREDMSFSAALDELEATQANVAPAPKLTTVTLPEGLSREEIAGRVKDAGVKGDYLAATRSVKGFNPKRYGAPADAPLEGFLFPATYELKPRQGVDALVKQQLRAFAANLAEVDLKRARRKNLTPYDIVNIASMIEREAGIAKDRRLISAVIYNRLQDGMPLGIDATLRYELKNWTDPLKVSELEADTPYNTRTNTGLPPTPIGNPGLASLQAAANPANVDFLFYVVKPCGNGAHNFSATDAEFQEDVAAYNAKREELDGKSPVTCK